MGTETNRKRARDVAQELPGYGSLRASEQNECVHRLTALLDERDREHDEEVEAFQETIDYLHAERDADDGREPLALVARVVELEGALEHVRQAVSDSFEDRGGPAAGHYTAWVCPLCGTDTEHDEACPVLVIESAISPPSPAVEAVREVLKLVWCFIEPELDPETGSPMYDDERYLFEWWHHFKDHFPALVAGLEEEG